MLRAGGLRHSAGSATSVTSGPKDGGAPQRPLAHLVQALPPLQLRPQQPLHAGQQQPQQPPHMMQVWAALTPGVPGRPRLCRGCSEPAGQCMHVGAAWPSEGG